MAPLLSVPGQEPLFQVYLPSAVFPSFLWLLGTGSGWPPPPPPLQSLDPGPGRLVVSAVKAVAGSALLWDPWPLPRILLLLGQVLTSQEGFWASAPWRVKPDVVESVHSWG